MGWKWEKIDPGVTTDGVIWGDAATKGADKGKLKVVVTCDTQEDYDALVATLEASGYAHK